jgi:hypothetical protein
MRRPRAPRSSFSWATKQWCSRSATTVAAAPRSGVGSEDWPTEWTRSAEPSSRAVPREAQQRYASGCRSRPCRERDRERDESPIPVPDWSGRDLQNRRSQVRALSPLSAATGEKPAYGPSPPRQFIPPETERKAARECCRARCRAGAARAVRTDVRRWASTQSMRSRSEIRLHARRLGRQPREEAHELAASSPRRGFVYQSLSPLSW